MKNTKIPRCRNSSKRQSNNRQNSGKIDTLITNTRTLTFLASYRHFNNMWRDKLVLCARANIKQYSQYFK